MELEEIFDTALDITVKNLRTKDSIDFPEIDESELNRQVEQDKILITYCNNLLSIYHESLKKSLADQGIEI